jgi:hypothetical protein
MASQTDICNIALQKLGAGKIVSISEDSRIARSCLTAYTHCLEKELRTHPWRFAIQRASLAEDATPPDWGKAASYELPTDFLRLLSPYPEDNINDLDYEIEGRKIYSDEGSPLYIRYIARTTDPNLMDAAFRDVLACSMADQMCEELTQSNSKKASIAADKALAIKEARRANAIESISSVPPEDEWVTVRE